MGRCLTGGLIAHCLLLQENKEGGLLRAQETLTLIESTRFTLEVTGEALSAVTEVYLGLWEAGSAAEKRQLEGPLHRALAALRRCARIFPASAPRALLWHGRDAWNRGVVRLARRLGAASLRRAQRLHMPYEEALARKWIERCAEAPPGAAAGLTGEIRGVFHFLTRSPGSR